jgi:gliding motility-associated-like protein
LITGCPENIIQKTIGDDLSVTWSEPQATALCGSVETQRSHAPGDLFLIGETMVIYRFSDEAGNTSECAFNIDIQEEELIVDVAEAVTPDGDGKNDTWWISNIEKFADNSVLVIDRWGNEVFKTTGYNNVNVMWDGTGSSGTIVPSGTYFYTIEIRTEKSARRQTGFIEVIQ